MAQGSSIRVRTADGKPREWKALHTALGGQTFVRVYAETDDVEFIVRVDSPRQLDGLREKLGAAGVEEIVGGDTARVIPAAPKVNPQPSPLRGFQQQGRPPQQGRQPQRGGGQERRQHGDRSATATPNTKLPGKPYGFVALPKNLTTAPPVWHDGTSSKGRLSGEIRFELETLMPLLVGWERRQFSDIKSDRLLSADLAGVGQLPDEKPVLCPLRAPWGKRPVIIPGDSLKGLLRHELGALLGAPMERVAERSYSYRPNAKYPRESTGRFLVARLARVPKEGVEKKEFGEDQVRVPTRLELFPAELKYNKKSQEFDYRFDQNGGDPYRGGQGAGQQLNSKPRVHTSLKLLREATTEAADVPPPAQNGYLATLRHLVDLDHGHFSERHPDVPNTVTGDAARKRILEAAKNEVFQPGDLVWVEWDTEKKCIVSLGWHYYYRWAYTDSVRKDADAPKLERRGLFPFDKERQTDGDGAPKELSAVRRLFGYTGDNEGSAGIGKDDHAQLMGRVFVNAGLEVVGDNESDDARFLKPTFLKELGMPRPSAVEYYIQQPHHPHSRPSDSASLVTYGDATGYDAPGELAGRKFYLDRPNAVAEDADSTNKRSTLALKASKPQRKFRFTVRFRDLDAAELAAIFVALCPNQFKGVLGGTHSDGYCSKLGYGRPLGWGSVCINAKALLLLVDADGTPTLKPEADLEGWVKEKHQPTEMQDKWLAIHRRNHPGAADYPREKARDGKENIYTFHARLRAEHSYNRRYKNGGTR